MISNKNAAIIYLIGLKYVILKCFIAAATVVFFPLYIPYKVGIQIHKNEDVNDLFDNLNVITGAILWIIAAIVFAISILEYFFEA